MTDAGAPETRLETRPVTRHIARNRSYRARRREGIRCLSITITPARTERERHAAGSSRSGRGCRPRPSREDLSAPRVISCRATAYV